MSNTTNLTGPKKVFNTIISIMMLILLFLSLVFVWGDVLEVSIRSTIGIEKTRTLFVGLNYYIFDGWKNVADIAKAYNNPTVTFGLYASLIISIVAFIATVAVTYYFGIKGIVDGLRAVIAKKDAHIVKNGAIIALTIFANYYISRLFAFHTYGPGLFNESFRAYIYSGWGSGTLGFFCWFFMILTLAYVVIEKFDTKNVTKSVRNILTAVSLIFVMALISNIMESSLGIGSSYTEWSIFDLFIVFAAVPLTEAAETFTIVETVLLILNLASAILLVVALVKSFFFDKEFNGKKILVYTGILFATSMATLVCGNPATEALKTSFDQIFNIDLTSDGPLSGNLSLAVILLALMITSNCLKSTKEDEAPQVVDAQ